MRPTLVVGVIGTGALRFYDNMQGKATVVSRSGERDSQFVLITGNEQNVLGF